MAYSAAFKFEVVLASLTRADSDKDVAREYDIHPVTLSRWKQRFFEDGQLVFEVDDEIVQRVREDDAPVPDDDCSLNSCIAEYVSEHSLDIDEKIEIVRALEPHFGLNRVCRAIGLAKSTWYYRNNQDVQSSA